MRQSSMEWKLSKDELSIVKCKMGAVGLYRTHSIVLTMIVNPLIMLQTHIFSLSGIELTSQ